MPPMAAHSTHARRPEALGGPRRPSGRLHHRSVVDPAAGDGGGVLPWAQRTTLGRVDHASRRDRRRRRLGVVAIGRTWRAPGSCRPPPSVVTGVLPIWRAGLQLAHDASGRRHGWNGRHGRHGLLEVQAPTANRKRPGLPAGAFLCPPGESDSCRWKPPPGRTPAMPPRAIPSVAPADASG